MTGENRMANAPADLVAADEALRAATALLELGLLRDAMSRATADAVSAEIDEASHLVAHAREGVTADQG